MTTSDPRDVLARIKARAEKATPGPWEVRMRSGVAVVPGIIAASHVRFPVKDRGTNAYEGETRHELTPLFVGQDEDAEFISGARTDVPRLVAALEAVLEMHRPTSFGLYPVCEKCSDDEHSVRHPCWTVRIIENALNEEEA